MKACSLILAALLVSSPALAEPDPSAVVAAERAFAADGLAHGIKRSFLAHSAPDAILFAPDPVNARELYADRPDKPHPPLVWWPLWAGIARRLRWSRHRRSGDQQQGEAEARGSQP